MNVQSDVNIGLVGHVDHGKTTLTKHYPEYGLILTVKKQKEVFQFV